MRRGPAARSSSRAIGKDAGAGDIRFRAWGDWADDLIEQLLRTLQTLRVGQPPEIKRTRDARVDINAGIGVSSFGCRVLRVLRVPPSVCRRRMGGAHRQEAFCGFVLQLQTPGRDAVLVRQISFYDLSTVQPACYWEGIGIGVLYPGE
jgi:hypothetical protein